MLSDLSSRDLKKSPTALKDCFHGTIFGTAIGDQLGLPFEGRPGPTIDPADIRIDQAGTYSDDTQLTLRVATSLARVKEFDEADMAREFVAWLDEPPIGPGQGCLQAVSALAAGTPPGQAASSSGGNGTAMRVSPVGLFFRDDPAGCYEAATRSSYLTHGHPGATIAAQAVALAVRYNSYKNEDFFSTSEFLDEVQRVRLDPEPPELADFRTIVDEVKKRAILGTEEEGLVALGQAGVKPPYYLKRYEGTSFVHPYALATVGCAFFLFIRHLGDPENAIRAAVQAGGDTDTVAAIVGALVGSLAGYARLPKRWRDGVYNAPGLEGAATALYEAYVERAGSKP